MSSPPLIEFDMIEIWNYMHNSSKKSTQEVLIGVE